MLHCGIFPRHAERRLGFVLLAIFLLTLGHARAGAVGVPISLAIEPATVKESDARQTLLKTTVTLQAPSPGYFVCEVRSQEKRKVTCSNIIFKKGDTEGSGTATVFWSNLGLDCTVKISAFNVDAPDTIVSCTINLQLKAEGSP